MYTWLPLTSKADLQKLKEEIPPPYAPADVAQKLDNGLSDTVKAVLIEKNYVDKDYRSAYYNFYAKKGRTYGRNCIRLHLFDETASFNPDTLRLSTTRGQDVSHAYFGYMTLRPTERNTIGRSVVSPDVRVGASENIIYAEHKVHVLGHRLIVQGFPWMQQHRDISICAHATCWSILRHYSERFSSYREFTIHDITMMAQQFNPGGLVPSLGLSVLQAERIFQEANTFPLKIHKAGVTDQSFYRQLAAFVDSGFPLFAALSSRKHAVAIVGYNWRKPGILVNSKVSFSWDQMENLCAVDDHYLPYSHVSADHITAFIAALPEKIYYNAEAVERYLDVLFTLGPAINLPNKDELIVRYYITTSSAFRQSIREVDSGIDPALLQTIMQIPFSQFIWVVEFATKPQWDTNHISARAVLDATASSGEHWPVWLFHSDAAALIFDRESGLIDPDDVIKSLPLKTSGAPLARMKGNLRHTQAK